MKRIFLKLIILGSVSINMTFATEFRSPWVSEKGLMRYKFERGDSEKYSFNMYGLGHCKEAHKAFMKHGTDAKNLSTLFFNKENIPLAEIFPNATVDRNASNYNPFIDFMTIDV